MIGCGVAEGVGGEVCLKFLTNVFSKASYGSNLPTDHLLSFASSFHHEKVTLIPENYLNVLLVERILLILLLYRRGLWEGRKERTKNLFCIF